MEQPFVITGRQHISLRPLTLADTAALATIANDPSIGPFVRDLFPHPYTLTHARDFLKVVAESTRLHCWGIFEQGSLAGVISLTQQEDIYRHTAEIGYWLGSPFRGKGIITEAIKLVCQYGFNQLNIIRIFANVFEHNKASYKALLKNGFEQEGIRKKGVIKNKELVNEYVMAKIK
jgi:RimJ/RimL family protein N-acetyltransferase